MVHRSATKAAAPLKSIRNTFTTFTFTAVALLQCSISSALAGENNIPKLDFNALGSVAVAGSFAGLELYDASSTSFLQPSSANNASSAQASLVSLDQSGQAQRLGNTDGQILAIVQCGKDGDVYFGGNFTTTDGVDTRNIGVYYSSNDTIAGVSGGLDGPVSALACDASTGTLYVGGSFNGPVAAGSGYKGAAATWSTSNCQWSPLDFGGFPGSDVDITTIALTERTNAPKSVIFGGRFDTYWLNQTSAANNVTVTTLANGTVAISSSNVTTLSPGGAVANVFPSLGSSLVPISLASAEITSSTTSSNSLYSDASSIFCPAGNDGTTGSTWLAQDGTQGRITARIFSPLEVGGFRIGNTNVGGSGTQTFSIVAIPNNDVLTLSYRNDPTSASSALSTCSDSCPLSHDASIQYEDFLISAPASNGTTTITGFQITLTSFYGPSAGLHLLQLLSPGSVSYAIDNQNRGYGQGVCTSGPYAVYGRSSSTHTPTLGVPWDHTDVASSTVSGTSEGMLCAATPVDTDPATAPVATWFPYIAQDGTYELYYFVPACSFDATCGQRGFVDVTVDITGTEGSTSSVTTINQEVTSDTNTLIYTGSIAPVGNNDQVTVTATLSSHEKATLAAGKGNKYYLIADKIVVVAKSTDGNGSTQIKVGTGANAVNVTATNSTMSLSYTRGYSLWEWTEGTGDNISPTVDTASTATQQVQALSSASALDQLAFNLGPTAVINKVLVSEDQAFVFLAGNFTYSSAGTTARSVLISTAGTAGLVSAPQGGLEGRVTDLAVADGWLYAVGDFSSSADGSLTGLAGKARCQYASLSARWESVPGLSTSQQALTVSKLGEDLVFTYPQQALDVWNPANASAVLGTNSLIVGTFVASSTAANNASVYLGGTVVSLDRYHSSGIAFLTNQGIQPASFGFDYAATAQASSSPTTSVASSATSATSSRSMALLKNRLRKRQSSPALPAPSTLPTSSLSTSTEPQILAVGFWQNSTSHEQITILGGSFVSSDDTVKNLGLLTKDGSLRPLGSEAVTGSIKTLKVVDNVLWVGGDFSLASGQAYLAAYDLNEQAWKPSDAVAVTAGTATVNSVVNRDGSVVVSGHFDSIAGVACSGVCEYSKDGNQWKSYGGGVSGVVSSVSLSENILFVAGSMVANNTSAYVMAWDYDNSTWTALSSDSLPGPALVISADTATSIFISGVSESDTASPYLEHWNGSQWSNVVTDAADQNSLVTQSSSVQQLALVPLTTEQPDSALFSSNDRALLVSGQLDLANLGQASSAIYDGSSWYPYLLSSSSSGDPGSIAGLFYSMDTISFGRSHHLAVGLVILISIAIALGIIFLCVLIALIITLSTRHDEPQAYPVVIPQFDNTDYTKGEATSPTPFLAAEKGKSRATPMLETLGAATAAISAGHPGVNAGAPRERHASRSTAAPTSSEDESIYYDDDDVEEADDSLPLRGVRYSFDAEREQELSISTSDMLEVLDDSDEHWHIVRRLRDGRQGLVPSAFLT